MDNVLSTAQPVLLKVNEFLQVGFNLPIELQIAWVPKDIWVVPKNEVLQGDTKGDWTFRFTLHLKELSDEDFEFFKNHRSTILPLMKYVRLQFPKLKNVFKPENWPNPSVSRFSHDGRDAPRLLSYTYTPFKKSPSFLLVKNHPHTTLLSLKRIAAVCAADLFRNVFPMELFKPSAFHYSWWWLEEIIDSSINLSSKPGRLKGGETDAEYYFRRKTEAKKKDSAEAKYRKEFKEASENSGLQGNRVRTDFFGYYEKYAKELLPLSLQTETVLQVLRRDERRLKLEGGPVSIAGIAEPKPVERPEKGWYIMTTEKPQLVIVDDNAEFELPWRLAVTTRENYNAYDSVWFCSFELRFSDEQEDRLLPLFEAVVEKKHSRARIVDSVVRFFYRRITEPDIPYAFIKASVANFVATVCRNLSPIQLDANQMNKFHYGRWWLENVIDKSTTQHLTKFKQPGRLQNETDSQYYSRREQEAKVENSAERKFRKRFLEFSEKLGLLPSEFFKPPLRLNGTLGLRVLKRRVKVRQQGEEDKGVALSKKFSVLKF